MQTFLHGNTVTAKRYWIRSRMSNQAILLPGRPIFTKFGMGAKPGDVVTVAEFGRNRLRGLILAWSKYAACYRKATRPIQHRSHYSVYAIPSYITYQ